MNKRSWVGLGKNQTRRDEKRQTRNKEQDDSENGDEVIPDSDFE